MTCFLALLSRHLSLPRALHSSAVRGTRMHTGQLHTPMQPPRDRTGPPSERGQRSVEKELQKDEGLRAKIPSERHNMKGDSPLCRIRVGPLRALSRSLFEGAASGEVSVKYSSYKWSKLWGLGTTMFSLDDFYWSSKDFYLSTKAIGDMAQVIIMTFLLSYYSIEIWNSILFLSY